MTKSRKAKPAVSADSIIGTAVDYLNVKPPAAVSSSGPGSEARAATTPPAAAEPTRAVKPPRKLRQLAALVVRDAGATLDQMIAATGWLPHTTRAALTGLKKKGYVITSDKVDGVRTYRGIAAE